MQLTARRSGGRRLLSGPILAGAVLVACAAPAPPAPAAGARAGSGAARRPHRAASGRTAGGPGAVVVQEGGREVVLDTAYASARTGPGGGLDAGQATPEEVRTVFAAALAAEPPRPVTFILYFVEGTDQFTPQSQALVDQILLTIAGRPAPELTVAGHTDALGTHPFNDALSLRRAERVRALLVARGISPSSVAAVGRGKRELLVPTPDGVAEPRNRRVEITVR